MFATYSTDEIPPFSVALCDYPGLPEPQRLHAEARYARTLIRQLGGESMVMETYRALQNLEEATPEEVTAETQALYHRWVKAVRAASEAGMQGLGGEEACYFEIKT